MFRRTVILVTVFAFAIVVTQLVEILWRTRPLLEIGI
jgi:hypothetical protein